MNSNYVNYLKSEQKSANTIRNYTNYARECINFIGKDEKDIRVEDIISYKASISNQSSATVAIKINAIKNYFSYLEMVGEIMVNPTTRITIPKIKNREKPYITADDISALISKARTNRDKAVISTIASTGLRMSEIASITIADWNTMNKYNQREMVIRGKGDKERTIYFNDMAYDFINKMLADRVGKQTSGMLFETLRGNELSDVGMNTMLKTTARHANLPYWQNLTVHGLRAAFATIASDRNCPIAVISKAMGHSNIATTSRYIKTCQSDVNNIMNDMMF